MLLLLALAPSVVLIGIGLVSYHRPRLPPAIATTALATGLALLVLALLVVVANSIAALHSIVDSQAIVLGLPLASFGVALGVLARRGRLSLPSAAACGIVGLVGLWSLGGLVLMLSACSFSPGGC